MIEDSPPNVPASPVPDEITELEQRATLPPPDEVNARMVALSLSSMATTLEQIQIAVSVIPELARSVQALERQHGTTIREIREAKGAANLAGGIASRALDEVQELRTTARRIESAVDRLGEGLGRLAQSVQGLEQASRSLVESVFPGREPESDPGLADVVPIHRVMTGE